VALSTGADTVLVLSVDEQASRLDKAIPVTQLVKYEGVEVRDLRWSPDGRYITFTEMHYYASTGYAPDIRLGYKVPYSMTPLVRMYSTETNETETVVVGSNAFLITPSGRRPGEGVRR
jgi:Tol biopolymer transport system component